MDSLSAQHLSASLGEGIVGAAHKTVGAVERVLEAAHLSAAEISESLLHQRRMLHSQNPRLARLHTAHLLGSGGPPGLLRKSSPPAPAIVRSGCTPEEEAKPDPQPPLDPRHVFGKGFLAVLDDEQPSPQLNNVDLNSLSYPSDSLSNLHLAPINADYHNQFLQMPSYQ